METANTPILLEQFTAEMFEPFRGKKIRFLRPAATGVEEQAVNLELIDVSRSPYAAGGARQPFSLLFTLQDEAPLNDRLLHRISQEPFAACDLLLSRVHVPQLDRRDGTMYFEAVFA